jgi:hypothetical protein
LHSKACFFHDYKTEFKTENYFNISPILPTKKRLKIGSFKVEATGFRLGERFIKITFDNAIAQNVDEIYLFNVFTKYNVKRKAIDR